MRVNIYAEEMTTRVELIKKTTQDGEFTGIRFYLELPATVSDPDARWAGESRTQNVSGPFIHHEGDDDSAAVTFWGKKQLKVALEKALKLLEETK